MTNNIKIISVENANDYVGIRSAKNKIEVYVPQMFRQEQEDNKLKKDLLSFIKTLEISKAEERNNVQTSNGTCGEIWPIDSFLWIIRDYLMNGVFYKREKIYSNERNGKIDWKRTLKTVPIYSNGKLIYDKLVTSKMVASNDMISQIYKLCVKYSVKRIGWLFDYNFYIDVQQLATNIEMIQLVKKELSSTFEDEKRMRYKHMLKILQNITEDNALTDLFEYGITNYYYVFEQMVDILFKGIKGDEKKEYYPSGYWQMNNDKGRFKSHLKFDTIYMNNQMKEVFIIDAKMYQYGFTKSLDDLPATESMQKQITYGDYVVKKINKDKETNDTVARNAFILPYNKELKKFKNDIDVVKYNDANLAYIGKAFVDWRDDENIKDHDFIYSFLIDFNYLIQNYKTEDTEMLDVLIDEINRMIKEA